MRTAGSRMPCRRQDAAESRTREGDEMKERKKYRVTEVTREI